MHENHEDISQRKSFIKLNNLFNMYIVITFFCCINSKTKAELSIKDNSALTIFLSACNFNIHLAGY